MFGNKRKEVINKVVELRDYLMTDVVSTLTVLDSSLRENNPVAIPWATKELPKVLHRLEQVGILNRALASDDLDQIEAAVDAVKNNIIR